MVEKKQKELLIIIPAYNEEKNIERVLEELERPEIAEIADILVMNDASSDSTNWVVKAHGHTLVSHVFNLGYGSALQSAVITATSFRWMRTDSMMCATYR